jgi:hypothetical protein
MAAMKGRRLNVGVHTLTNGSITAMCDLLLIITNNNKTGFIMIMIEIIFDI